MVSAATSSLIPDVLPHVLWVHNVTLLLHRTESRAEVHVPQNSYVAALTCTVAVCGDGASKEVTEANEVIRAGPWFSKISVLVRRHDGELERGKGHVRTRQGGCCLQVGKRVLTCSQAAGSLVPGFQPP